MKNNYNVITFKNKSNYKIDTLKCLYKVITFQKYYNVITSTFLMLGCFLPVAGQALSLLNTPEQGGLVYGQTEPETHLYWHEKKIPLSPEGTFVFAVPADATETDTLIIQKGFQKQKLSLTIRPRQWQEEVVNGLEPAKVTLSPENQKRARKEAQVVQKSRQKAASRGVVLNQTEKPLPTCFVRPTDPTARISSQFGSRRILNGVKKQGHSGVDYALPTGSPVFATQEGVVLLAHPDLFYTGQTILIDHGYGVVSSYSHLNQLDVQTGDFVRRGQKIGEIGMTGRATGPHLHFVITWQGIRIDPERALQNYPCPSLPTQSI